MGGWLNFDSDGNIKTTENPLRYSTRSISAAATVASGDYFIFLLTTAAAGSFTVTLPSASANAGAQFTFLDAQGNANNKSVTIAATGGDDLDGVNNGTYVINIPREAVSVISDGTNWFTI